MSASALTAYAPRSSRAAGRGQVALIGLATVVAACPFDDYPADVYRRYATFFREGFDRAGISGQQGVVGVLEREVLTVVPIAAPPGQDINGNLGRLIKVPGTTRYWNVASDVLALMT